MTPQEKASAPPEEDRYMCQEKDQLPEKTTRLREVERHSVPIFVTDMLMDNVEDEVLEYALTGIFEKAALTLKRSFRSQAMEFGGRRFALVLKTLEEEEVEVGYGNDD